VTLWEYAAGRDCPLGCEHGTCEPGSGACVCAEGWGGDDCSQALCGTPCGEHGTCDVLTRECICSLPWFGPGCAQRTCAADCVAPRGTCDANDGRCLCAAPWYGRACEFARCPPCAGPSARCDNATGACRCAPGYEGADCASLTPGRWHRDLQLPSAQRDEEAHPVGGYSPRGQAGPGLRYGASHGVCDGQPVLFSGVVPDGDGGGGDYGGDGGGGDGDGGGGGGGGGGRPLSKQLWTATLSDGQPAVWSRLVASGDPLVGAPSPRRGGAAVGLGGSKSLRHTMALHGGVGASGQVRRDHG